MNPLKLIVKGFFEGVGHSVARLVLLVAIAAAVLYFAAKFGLEWLR